MATTSYFTETDLTHAVEAMLAHAGVRDMQLQGTMSGIKRRARTRALINFAKQLDPAPPDHSITTMRALLRKLFGRSISNNDLHRHFGTPGRKADNRVDVNQFAQWLMTHEERLHASAVLLIAELDVEWGAFTAQAARKAGELRQQA